MKKLLYNEEKCSINIENDMIGVYFNLHYCNFPKDWLSEEMNCVEFYKILLQECKKEPSHVSLRFYRAMKRFMHNKEFECLLEDV